MDERRQTTTEIEVPFKTYAKGILILLGAYLIYLLSPLILLLLISLLVAVTLGSLERFLIRRGWKKKAADAVLIFGLVAIISSIVFVVIPQALSQMNDLMTHWPQFEKDITTMAPQGVRKSAGKLLTNSPASLERIWEQIGILANHTLTGIFETAVMLIAAVYMLLDGPKVYAWILAFFKKETRDRIDDTSKEIVPIVEAYIIGQATTSTLAAIWVFVTAKVLGVPGAMTLAVLAAFFDILPGLGLFLNVITAGLLALSVNTHTALMMVLAMAAYSALENYVLIPHIYGRRMKLSPLAVLVSLIMSGAVAGIPGMIVILPVVAAFGPIERHWFKGNKNLEKTVMIHQRLDEKEHPSLKN